MKGLAGVVAGDDAPGDLDDVGVSHVSRRGAFLGGAAPFAEKNLPVLRHKYIVHGNSQLKSCASGVQRSGHEKGLSGENSGVIQRSGAAPLWPRARMAAMEVRSRISDMESRTSSMTSRTEQAFSSGQSGQGR